MTTDFMIGYLGGLATAILALSLAVNTRWFVLAAERQRWREIKRYHHGRPVSVWWVLASVGILMWVFVWAVEAWAWVWR